MDIESSSSVTYSEERSVFIKIEHTSYIMCCL